MNKIIMSEWWLKSAFHGFVNFSTSVKYPFQEG